MVAYRPLCRPGYQKDASVPILIEDPLVKKLATKYDKTPAQIALRYLVSLSPEYNNWRRTLTLSLSVAESTRAELQTLRALKVKPSRNTLSCCNLFLYRRCKILPSYLNRQKWHASKKTWPRSNSTLRQRIWLCWMGLIAAIVTTRGNGRRTIRNIHSIYLINNTE